VTESVKDILRMAHETLDTAHLGYAVVRDVPARAVAGLRNVAVFGAAAMTILEKLRAADAAAAAWYKPIRKKLAASVLVRLFEQLHAEFRKRDAAGVSSQARLKTFNYPADLEKLGKRPPRASELFMGDEIGGTGWEVDVFPGMKEKYYVVLPTEYGTVDLFLANTAVVQTSRDPRKIDIANVCDQYVSALDEVLRGAELQFNF
jgi:hypothetical protein